MENTAQAIDLLNSSFEDELGEDLIKYYLFYVEELAKLLARNGERNELIRNLESLDDNEIEDDTDVSQVDSEEDDEESEMILLLQDSEKRIQAITALREEGKADIEQYIMTKQLLEGIAQEVDRRMSV